MRVITLKPQPLTPEGFEPFGNILDADRSEIVCTDGALTARITHAPLRDLSAEQPHFLNRHMEETQIFVPLGGKDGLFFVGPPSETPDSFDPATVALFHFPGTCAIRMHVGTWHVAPFAVTEPIDYINIQGDQVRNYTDGYDFKEHHDLVFQFDLS
jgi:ureidoglycolate hydrolase